MKEYFENYLDYRFKRDVSEYSWKPQDEWSSINDIEKFENTLVYRREK